MTKSTHTLSVLTQGLVQSLAHLLNRGTGFWNLPLHFARANLVLRDAAGAANDKKRQE